MGAIISIQLSVFSNKNIKPTTENIAVLMPKVKELSTIDFLPNVVNTQKFDVASGKIENVLNLAFSSIGKKDFVVCSDSRIDCSFGFEQDEQDKVEDRFTAMILIIKYIMQRWEVFANRLALNVYFLSDLCDGSSTFETNIMHIEPFYEDKNIKEWSCRTNAEGVIQIDEHDEKLNIITEYNYVKSPKDGGRRIICHADINTLGENSDYRFDYESIDKFMGQVKQIFVNMQAGWERLVP